MKWQDWFFSIIGVTFGVVSERYDWGGKVGLWLKKKIDDKYGWK